MLESTVNWIELMALSEKVTPHPVPPLGVTAKVVPALFVANLIGPPNRLIVSVSFGEDPDRVQVGLPAAEAASKWNATAPIKDKNSPPPRINNAWVARQAPDFAAHPDIPTIGLLRWIAPVDPKNRASPKLKMPPSDATSQYPFPV